MWHKGLMILISLAIPSMAFSQTTLGDPELTGAAWSPYLVGLLIGVLSWLTFYFSNKPLGASTAYARIAGKIGMALAPEHTRQLHYFSQDKNKPRIDWGVMLVVGVVLGSFVAALSGGEALARWVPPMWQERFGPGIALRLVVAFTGGALMAMGARMAGGCTSGHGISGALQLSVGSWLALAFFFVGGAVVAHLMY